MEAANMGAKRPCPSSDALSAELLTLWCTGDISAIALQKLANAAIMVGVNSTVLLSFAKLGTWGRHKSNIHRDLVRLLSENLRLPTPMCVLAPCLDTKKNPPLSEAAFPILLPHVMVATLAAEYPFQYENLFRPCDAQQFWSSVNPADPRLQHNPICRCNRKQFVPLWLHGDGVEFSTDSMLMFSWGSMLCNASSMESCLLIAAWPKIATSGNKHSGPEHTWSEIYRIIAWSFRALWDGKHPTRDWRGEPIADKLAGTLLVPNGTRFCLWQLVGDLEYYANCLHLPHWSCDKYCWLCNCDKSVAGKSPADVRDEPGWELKSVESMLANPASSHPFFSEIPGPAANLRPGLDGLHTVDLGLAPCLCGGILHCLAFPSDAAVKDAPARIADIWAEIQASYTQLGSADKFSNLVLSMIGATVGKPWSSSPELKGRAAEIRHFVPALAVVAKRRAGTSAAAAHMSVSIENLARFYMELDSQVFRTIRLGQAPHCQTSVGV